MYAGSCGPRCFFLFALLCWPAVGFAQPVEVPNPSFETANTDAAGPEAWALSGGPGEFRAEGAEGLVLHFAHWKRRAGRQQLLAHGRSHF